VNPHNRRTLRQHYKANNIHKNITRNSGHNRSTQTRAIAEDDRRYARDACQKQISKNSHPNSNGRHPSPTSWSAKTASPAAHSTPHPAAAIQAPIQPLPAAADSPHTTCEDRTAPVDTAPVQADYKTHPPARRPVSPRSPGMPSSHSPCSVTPGTLADSAAAHSRLKVRWRRHWSSSSCGREGRRRRRR
jgi:hypothetical protein